MLNEPLWPSRDCAGWLCEDRYDIPVGYVAYQLAIDFPHQFNPPGQMHELADRTLEIVKLLNSIEATFEPWSSVFISGMNPSGVFFLFSRKADAAVFQLLW